VRRSPSENINLPQALLSRFDLLFLLMDRVNSTVDFNLAKHITHVHRFETAPQVPLPPPLALPWLPLAPASTQRAECRRARPSPPELVSHPLTAAHTIVARGYRLDPAIPRRTPGQTAIFVTFPPSRGDSPAPPPPPPLSVR
jgi:hypothetical protein